MWGVQMQMTGKPNARVLDLIETWRRYRGETQTDVAERLGISKQAWAHVRAGRRPLPRTAVWRLREHIRAEGGRWPGLFNTAVAEDALASVG